MDKSAIRNFAIEARKMLMKSAETEAGFYGVTKDGCKSPIQRGNDFEVYETIAGTENRIYGADIKRRANLVKAVETLGFEQVIEETAYTWFNRIIAIRFMEVNDYLPTRVRVLSSETGSSTPDIVTQSLDVDLNMTPEELEKVQKAKDENRYDDAFRMLFIKQCNELNSILPGLFEKTDDYMELLLKLSYTSDGVVRMLIDTIDENNFNVETEGQVEIIGWLYQFYNTEEFNAIYDGNLSKEQVNKYLIPAATQLFTPDWVVRYMIENTLGRMWIEGHEENEFLSNWKYYVSDCEQNEEVRKKLEEIKKVYAEKGPEDIKVFDPCMGSGHILVYAFDVLMQLYEVSGYSQRDAVEHILQKNIYGIDIDERAYQLSYFAIMMKARQYDRRIFSKKIQCNICTIVESNGISVSSLNYFGDGLSDDDRKRAISDLSSLIKLFTDAKEYGSVLNIEKYDWNFLRKFLSTEMYGQITLDAGNLIEVKSRLEKIISVAEIMSQKYEVVCTNPPYLGSSKFSSKLSNYIEKNYKDEKPDLGMVMLNKMLFSYADVNAYIGAITTVSWMFIKSFEKFRSKVLKSKDFVCLVDFGTELFEGKIGHLPVASWINRNSLINQKMTAIRLVDFCYSRRDEKKPEFYNKDNYFSISQSDFFKIQGAPIAYWVSDSVLTAFSERNVGSISEPRMGLTTGRNDKYLRLWYEVEFDNIGFGFNRERAQESRLRWFPYDKGGDYRKWYGNRNYVVDWYDDGHEMQTTMHPNGNRIWAHNFNLEYNFREHISWNDVVLSELSFRFFEEGFLFDSAAATVFVPAEKKYALLAYLNSEFVNEIAKLLNPTVHFKLGDYSKLPYGIWDEEMLSDVAKECVRISKDDWDSYDTSWDFKKSPLVCGETDIMLAIENYICSVKKRKKLLVEKEKEINNYFAELYQISADNCEDKLGSSVYIPSKREIVTGFISYAVGCMFGRYSLDLDGVVFAGGIWDSTKYRSYQPVTDGIISITDSDYFDDDIVSRFVNFVSCVFGEQNLEKNLEAISDILETKGSTSREKIRNYFIGGFYKEHCNSYSVTGSGKRPIYWLFDSGKQNGFKCLIYMHRYNKDTLNLIRSEYLRKTEDAVENALKNAEYIIQTSASAVERAKATKDRDKYVKQLNEMKIYYQALSHLALQKIEIDLDDGVKHNYQLFQGVEVIVDGGKKQKVDLLAKI